MRMIWKEYLALAGYAEANEAPSAAQRMRDKASQELRAEAERKRFRPLASQESIDWEESQTPDGGWMFIAIIAATIAMSTWLLADVVWTGPIQGHIERSVNK